MESSKPENSAGATTGRRVPFLDLLGLRPVPVSGGGCEFELEVDEKHLQSMGIMHGGVSAALLDSAMGYAVWAQAPDGKFVVTVQLSVNFIRPAWKGETLRIVAEVHHSGSQTAVASGEIRTSADVLVSSATGTFMYLPKPDTESGTLEQHADEGDEPTP